MSEIKLKIENMHCGSCVRRVTETLNSIPGVLAEEVTIGAARVKIDEVSSPAIVVEAVVKAGYPAHLVA